MKHHEFPPLPLPTDTWERIAQILELPPQQKRIVELMLRDMCGKQIAAEMKVKIPTLRTYISRIYERTGVANEKALLLLICGMSHGLRHPER